MHLELVDIHKHFGSVHANRGVRLEVRPGSIHGLLGENGAGKSTLMKILAGFLPRTGGTIRVNGREVELRRPAEATARGIGMLYQDPLDFPPLSVLENFQVGLAREPRPSTRRYREDLLRRAGAFGFDLDPGKPAARLTVGERQQLELLRLLALGVEVLILDEPTTGISNLQKEVLFRALRRLAGEGKSVILVSHKLEDVEALCHRVTVLRRGEVAGEAEAPFDTGRLLSLMFGAPPVAPPRCRSETGEPVLELRDVWAPGGRSGLRGADVAVRSGEVVGLAGVEGSGQAVFLRVAAGLQRPHRGEVRFRGHRLRGYEHRAQRSGGITFLPGGRLEEGLIGGLTVLEHFALNRPRVPFVIPWDRTRREAEEGIGKFRVKGRPDTPVEALSGGNQQRLLLSFIPPEPALLLLEHPTRGLDLASAHQVWRELQRHCRAGTAIAFSSAELDEILAIADRVLVFYNGEVVSDVATDRARADEVAAAIAGKVPSR